MSAYLPVQLRRQILERDQGSKRFFEQAGKGQQIRPIRSNPVFIAGIGEFGAKFHPEAREGLAFLQDFNFGKHRQVADLPLFIDTKIVFFDKKKLGILLWKIRYKGIAISGISLHGLVFFGTSRRKAA